MPCSRPAHGRVGMPGLRLLVLPWSIHGASPSFAATAFEMGISPLFPKLYLGTHLSAKLRFVSRRRSVAKNAKHSFLRKCDPKYNLGSREVNPGLGPG